MTTDAMLWPADQRGCRTCAWGLLMLAAVAATTRAQSTTPADSVDATVAGVEQCLGRLDHLRFCASPKTDRIATVVSEGLALLTAGKTEASSGASTDQVSRCQLDLMRGTLYLYAAAASDSTSSERRTYVDAALNSCQATRVDYTSLPLSRLSYLQQSHAARLAGDFQAAYKALDPLIGDRPSLRSASSMELRRSGSLARLEVTLLADPAKAIAEADILRRSPLMAKQQAWLARTEWLVARACVAAWLELDGADPTEDSATLRDRAVSALRSETVCDVAPAHDRLNALASLATAEAPVMNRAELLQWAEMLAAGDHPEAVDVYRRLQASSSEPFPAAAQFSLALTLFKQGRYIQAAVECDALLASAATESDLAAKAMPLRAGSLLKASAASPPDAAETERLLSALLALSDCLAVPVDVRTDGLRQWVAIRTRQSGQAACVPTLESRWTLVTGDAHLAYALAAGTWQAAGDRAGGVTAADAAGTGELAAKAQELANQSRSQDLAARAALLRAIVLSTSPVNDTHAALAVLNQDGPLLAACEATAPIAAWLRVRLLLDAGLIDEAVNSLPPAAADDAPDMIIRIAGLLADRADTLDTVTRGRVVAMCSRALGCVATDGPAYRRVARRCAGILLTVGSHVDANAILNKLLHDEAIRSDSDAYVECSLMMVEALRLGGSTAQADAILTRLVASHPNSPETHLAQAKMKMILSQPAEAAAACRQARAVCPPGSVQWCRATLQLAKALQADRHDGAAMDILRVSAALYPAFGNAELKAELKRFEAR